jgi:trk system potassium uptake protein TrkA
VREADALAAVTSGDNSNILTARIARETYQIENVVARIYDPRRALIYQRLGIPTVATVTWTTEQVMRRLFSETTAVDWTDSGGRLSLVERMLPPVWAGHKLASLGEPGRYRIMAVSRAGEARLAGPDLVGQEGDILHIAVTKDDMEALDGQLAHGPEGGH